ncbi:MAG: glycosyltransferase family 4 protein [Beijerinckiaceae bacterium]|jgi:glycosyltransferase involved in cell wall biosynthesis
MRPGLISPRSGASVLTGRTILQIIPELNAGGAERTAIDVAAALAQAGARALVASEGGRLVSELQALGGVWIPFPARTKNPISMALNVGRLKDVIAREGVDLVHARSRAPAWSALGATRSLRKPFVTTYHGAYGARSQIKAFYNSVMARGDVVIANSHYTARLIESAYPESAGRIIAIHRGADLRAFAPDAVHPARVQKLRAQWGVQPDERVVLLAARLTAWKGQRVLIEAARILSGDASLRDVRYVLAGDPQGRAGYVRELDQQIAEAGLAGVVLRVGHCEDMPAAFLAADCVVVASTEPEAFGRSAVEAQAMGAPVVVTDIGAVPETVLAPPETPDDARTGWRIPPNDAPALARSVAHALSLGASQRDALALRARGHVEAHFSLPKMCAQTLEIYAALLEGRRPQPIA